MILFSSNALHLHMCFDLVALIVFVVVPLHCIHAGAWRCVCSDVLSGLSIEVLPSRFGTALPKACRMTNVGSVRHDMYVLLSCLAAVMRCVVLCGTALCCVGAALCCVVLRCVVLSVAASRGRGC